MSGKQFVVILIFTLCTVLIWLVADIIHTRASQETVSPEVTKLMEPINPNFDQNAINEL